jgi:hypothetical protein
LVARLAPLRRVVDNAGAMAGMPDRPERNAPAGQYRHAAA